MISPAALRDSLPAAAGGTDLFKAVLSNLTEGAILTDLQGRLLFVNAAARAAFHLDGNVPVGRPVENVFIHPELLALFQRARIGTACRGEILLETGEVLNAQLTPIPDVGLAVIFQNITHLKQMDRMKSDLVTTVSHDLRSPLTAILGYVDLIERVGPVTDQQREFIRRAQENVRSISALITDLLDLGQIEAGFDAQKELLSLGEAVEWVLEELQLLAAQKSQEVRVSVAKGLPLLHAHPVRIRQLLNNLIGNAILYTQTGGRVEVGAWGEGGQVILRVSDNGPGIPLEEQGRIFDKFYRGSNRGKTPGTGLGLAIVRSIVANHQGRVWVESTQGAGAKFTVVLPAAASLPGLAVPFQADASTAAITTAHP